MIYGLWLSATGLQTNGYRQDVIANNLANAETVGFKHDLSVFSERPVASREPFGDPTMTDPMLNDMTGGTFVAPTFTVYEQGTLRPTDRPLDAALVGEGFFSVRDGDGVKYTRDGRFTLTSEGGLVTVAGGRPVLSDAGTPIRVPPERAGEVAIRDDGTIRAGATLVGRLAITDFADKSRLTKVGSNLFEASSDAVERTPSATVRSGYVEASTVDPTRTMVQMIEATRAYDLNALMITLQDSLLGKASTEIAQLA